MSSERERDWQVFSGSQGFLFSEAVLRRCSVKKGVLKNSQNSHEITCAGVFGMKYGMRMLTRFIQLVSFYNP